MFCIGGLTTVGGKVLCCDSWWPIGVWQSGNIEVCVLVVVIHDGNSPCVNEMMQNFCTSVYYV